MAAPLPVTSSIDHGAGASALAVRRGSPTPIEQSSNPPGTHSFTVTAVATYSEPWALAFIPHTNEALITLRRGQLVLRDMASGTQRLVSGLPDVRVDGQGGLGDVIVDPWAPDIVLLSWVERGADGTSGAVVGVAQLDRANAALVGLTRLWTQTPKVTGAGHFSHRLALSPDGRSLFITSGDRQKFTPAQDPTSDLGKIIRYDLRTGGLEHWTLGHRNPLGIAFAPDGRLWSTEMGPQGGDELNLIVRGGNYGWPNASNGSHYGGADIPDHRPGDGYVAPLAWWNPSISPSSLMIYTGSVFPNWYGDAFIGALSGTALVRVDLYRATAATAERWPMNRIRAVVQGPDGTIWLLEDGTNARLLHLTPA